LAEKRAGLRADLVALRDRRWIEAAGAMIEAAVTQ
jgi:hypothetical protein